MKGTRALTKLLFHEIPDAIAIVRRGGVEKQVNLFHRNGRVYAAASGGYVRIGTNGNTAVPNLTVMDIDGPTFTVDGLGWFEYKEGKVTNLRSVG